MMPFAPGDHVTVIDGYLSAPVKITTIKAVGKLKVTLTDGSEWRVKDCRRWGSGTWERARIREAREADQDVIDRRRYTDYLTQNGFWDKVPLDVLREIAERLNALKAGKSDV